MFFDLPTSFTLFFFFTIGLLALILIDSTDNGEKFTPGYAVRGAAAEAPWGLDDLTVALTYKHEILFGVFLFGAIYSLFLSFSLDSVFLAIICCSLLSWLYLWSRARIKRNRRLIFLNHWDLLGKKGTFSSSQEESFGLFTTSINGAPLSFNAISFAEGHQTDARVSVERYTKAGTLMVLSLEENSEERRKMERFLQTQQSDLLGESLARLFPQFKKANNVKHDKNHR